MADNLTLARTLYEGWNDRNFDAIVEATAPDGKIVVVGTGDEFKGPEELRDVLVKQREAFARCLTTKLMTYALGRGLQGYDTRTVRAIADRLPASQYRFSALVLEIVKSLPFQQRRVTP